MECRLLGTPNEEIWPGVSKLINWHEYPQWTAKPLSSAVPGLDENGLHLLGVSSWFRNQASWEANNVARSWSEFSLLQEMLHYEPSRRISAKKAMEHPYFDDFDKSLLWKWSPDFPMSGIYLLACFPRAYVLANAYWHLLILLIRANYALFWFSLL